MENLFSFKGKIGNLEYLQISLLCYLILYFYILVASLIFKPGHYIFALFVFILTFFVIGTVIAIKLSAVTRRIRDIGIAMPFLFLIFIPVVNIAFSGYLLFAKGKSIKINTTQNEELDQEEHSGVKTCSYCCAKIPVQAKKCMYCGEWVDFEAFEEIENNRSYWPANIILAAVIIGLSIYATHATRTNIFSKNIFKVKVLEDYYSEALDYCNRFNFKTDKQKYNCEYTHIEDHADSKHLKELTRINQNCRTTNYLEADYRDCVYGAILRNYTPKSTEEKNQEE